MLNPLASPPRGFLLFTGVVRYRAGYGACRGSVGLWIGDVLVTRADYRMAKKAPNPRGGSTDDGYRCNNGYYNNNSR